MMMKKKKVVTKKRRKETIEDIVFDGYDLMIDLT
jgi:hypothetical protein